MSLYVDPGDLAVTLKISPEMNLDDDLERACFAASQAIDECCDTTFQLSDSSNDETRLYTPEGPGLVIIDDLATFTSLRVDRDQDGDYEEHWAEWRDFVLERGDGFSRPYTRISARDWTRRFLPFPRSKLSVQVTGRFGWLETPPAIVEATGLLASQLIKRRLEAPFGIVSFGIDQPTAARVLKSDPHLLYLVEPYERNAVA